MRVGVAYLTLARGVKVAGGKEGLKTED